MRIDYWYNHTFKDIAGIDCFFSDTDCIYRGNIYDASGNFIGDYWTRDSLEIEKRFGHLRREECKEATS